MKILNGILSLLLLSFLIGCGTSAQVAGQVQPGRYALHRGDFQEALADFQRAAETDPNYVTNFTLLKQGVWTYVGRAYYDLGNLSEARKALERANSLHKDDYMADLYLGLVLVRQGDRERGPKEIQTGLKGLHDWLESIDAKESDGKYWDPGRGIRTQIQKDLEFMSGKDVDWKEVIARGERIGDTMETRIDESKRWRERDMRKLA